MGLGKWKVVMCLRAGKDHASAHPRGQKPPLGGGPSAPAWHACLGALGQRRMKLPFLLVASHRAVNKGKCGFSGGTTDQSKGKGRSGERPIATTAYGGKGKGSGEGRIGHPILKQMRSLAPRGHGREVAKPMAVPFPQVQGQIAGPQ